MKHTTYDPHPLRQGLSWLIVAISEIEASSQLFNPGAHSQGSSMQGPLHSWQEEQSTLQLAIARLSIPAADLIMQLLRIDAKERLSAAAALQHPFFSGLHPFRHASRQQEKEAITTAPAVKVGCLNSGPECVFQNLVYSSEIVLLARWRSRQPRLLWPRPCQR